MPAMANRLLSERARFGVILAALFGIAVALRSYRLTYWNIEGDEINTLRDSLSLPGFFNSAKPLIFFLNHYLVAPWTELDEFGLRILPALFGILAVPAMYWLGRRTLGVSVGLFAALLVTFSPWHLYWSQYARYYSLVFLLSAGFPLLLYLGLRDRNARLLVAGLATAMAGMLAHASTGLLLVTFGVWLALTAVPRADLRRSTTRWTLVTGGLIGAVIVGLVLYRLLPQLIRWNNLPQDWGHNSVSLLLSYVDWLSPIVLLFGIAGTAWMWRDGERALASLFAVTVTLPLVLVGVLSFFVPVSTAYVFCTTPLVFVACAYFLDRLTSVGPRVKGTGIVVTASILAIIAAGGPHIFSHFRDGSRLDFRGAAEHLRRHAVETDVLLSDQPRVLAYYLSDQPVQQFERATASLAAAAERARQISEDGEIWIVAAIRRRGGFSDIDLGAARDWVRDHCTLSESFFEPRLDYKYNELQVYRCTSVG
jgi:mannosyltransferase